jgi:hypothetical protein
VELLMASDIQGEEILIRIIAQQTARLNVMDLRTFHPPARLATPTISLKDLPAKLTINFGG